MNRRVSRAIPPLIDTVVAKKKKAAGGGGVGGGGASFYRGTNNPELFVVTQPSHLFLLSV